MSNPAPSREFSPLPTNWSGEVSVRFRLISSLLYLGGMGAHLVYVWRNDCGFAFFTQGPAVYSGLLLGMIGFEFWAHRQYGERMTQRVGIWLIAARIVLYEIAASMDCTSFAIMFYMLIPFLAYLFIDKWAAIGLSVLFITWVTYKVGAFRCRGCSLDESVTPIVLLSFGLMWSTAMGGLVRLLESNRVRTKQLLSDLNHSHQSLKNYAERIEQLTATEERNRLARDIHDNLGHSLAVVNVQLEKALVYQEHDQDIAREAIQNARRAAREALRDVRESVHTLRESNDIFSLTTALEMLTKQSKSGDLEIVLDIEGEETDYPQPSLMALYRAAQEGLTNIHKHANASRVEIKVVLGEKVGTMEIWDNGQGFNPEEIAKLPANRPGQYGLQGIRERLELAGGSLKIASSTSRGTFLFLTLPKQKSNEISSTQLRGRGR